VNAAAIQFDPLLHEYRVGGVRWPSVTDVIDMLGELDGIPRAELEAAAKFGTAVHGACHLDNCGALDWQLLDPHLAPYVQAWRRAQVDLRIIVTASEQMVSNVQLRYCGRLDVLARTSGVRELIDLKSTATIPRTVGPQTFGYADALGEPLIRRRVVLLRPDGTYRTDVLRDPRDRSNFVSALNVLNWRLER
jgi:hypothetical protein